ncbi:MAG: DUF3488 domain-containing transglutaminase family protein [Nitrospirae bacterium]|nr:DUF3488 domain-containing transglutaminase family protein [Nitrospirota bacterium]MBF0533542.1 DUF3488 domain-containing transglutaminase family protein [Nitrospirota bacterium]MBF0615934.1 DUF3488 domain-containing transglutaminase family protein [Nitrospirota bacterium]
MAVGAPHISFKSAVKISAYTIALIAFFSVFTHISPVFPAAFIALLALAFYFDFKKPAHISRLAINLVSVIVIAVSVYRVMTEDIVEPSVEALIILLAMKFLEEKKFRDYMQIYLISVFVLMGSALLSIDFTFFLFFVVMFFLTAVSIVLLTYHIEAPELIIDRASFIKIIKRALLIPLASIPLTVVIFMILPRTNYQFLRFLNHGQVGTSGFSDTVSLGSVSSIQIDSSPVLRASMDPVDEQSLYWRGIVFDHFDGLTWKSSLREDEKQGNKNTLQGGKTILQTIYLQPYDNKFLFALDRPVSVSYRGSKISEDFTVSLRDTVKAMIKYDVISKIEVPLNSNARTIPNNTKRYLQLPDNVPPQILSLSKSLTGGRSTDEAIKTIYRYLHSGLYTYSLDKLPTSDTPLSDFLFKKRSGNCEYFASAMALMLRAAGIPANVIGGYKGGVYNNVGRYYIVLQKNAHVWVETFVEGKGWVRYDPTPPLSTNPLLAEKAELSSYRLLADSINYYWNSLVINYNFDKQLSIFNKLRIAVEKPVFNIKLKEIHPQWLYLAFLPIVFFVGYHLLVKRKTVEERLISEFYLRLSKRGFVKKSSEGLQEFVLSIDDKQLKTDAMRFALEFQQIFYKDMKFTSNKVRLLKDILASLAA